MTNYGGVLAALDIIPISHRARNEILYCLCGKGVRLFIQIVSHQYLCFTFTRTLLFKYTNTYKCTIINLHTTQTHRYMYREYTKGILYARRAMRTWWIAQKMLAIDNNPAYLLIIIWGINGIYRLLIVIAAISPNYMQCH